jgi:hypothetical protein
LTKVPDVLDSIRYDLEHNQRNLPVQVGAMPKLYALAKDFADSYVPQEYGITRREKLVIGSKMCCELLRKIRNDLILGTEGEGKTETGDMQYTLDTSHAEYLDVKSVGRRVRTRLYFTSESHLHTLLNVLKYGHLQLAGVTQGAHASSGGASGAGSGLGGGPGSGGGANGQGVGPVMDGQGVSNMVGLSELCYLTHLVIRVFENLSACKDDPDRFRVELSVSPGASRAPDGDEPSAPLPPTRVASAAAKLAAALPEHARASNGRDRLSPSLRPTSAAASSSGALSSAGAELDAPLAGPTPRVRGPSPPPPPFDGMAPAAAPPASGGASPPSSPNAPRLKSPSPRGAKRTSRQNTDSASTISDAGHPAAAYFENNPDDMVRAAYAIPNSDRGSLTRPGLYAIQTNGVYPS